MNVTTEVHDSGFGSEVSVARGDKEGVFIQIRWSLFTSGHVYLYEFLKDIQELNGSHSTEKRSGSFEVYLAGMSLEDALILLKKEMKSMSWDHLQKEKQNYLAAITRIEQQELIYV